MEANLAVRMVNITKTFSHVVANNNITLEIHRGEILSLLGENGSGKNNPYEYALRHIFPRQRADIC